MTVNSLGASYADGKSRGGAWLLPLAPIAISIFAISALVSYHLRASSITPRTIPQSVVIGVYEFLGWVPACMFFGLVFAWSSIWFVAGAIDRPGRKLLRVLGLTVALAVFGNLDASAPHTGALGAWIGGGMSSVIGSFLSHLLMAPVTFLALLFATDSFWMSYFERRVLERTRAELQAAAVGAASDSGVEPAVPEEFKQLARTLPPEAVEVAADADSETDLDAYFERLDRGSPSAQAPDEALAGAVAVADASSEDASAVAPEPAPVRLSYFERRRMREEQEAQREATAAAEAAAALGEAAPHAEDSAAEGAAPEAEGDEPIFEGLGEEIPSGASPNDAVAVGAPAVGAPGNLVVEAVAEHVDHGTEVANIAEGAPGEVSVDATSTAEARETAADDEGGATYEVRFEPLFASPTADAMRDELAADDEREEQGDEERESTEVESSADTGDGREPIAAIDGAEREREELSTAISDAGDQLASDASPAHATGATDAAFRDGVDGESATEHAAEEREVVDADEPTDVEAARIEDAGWMSVGQQPVVDPTREGESDDAYASPATSDEPIAAAAEPVASFEEPVAEPVTECAVESPEEAIGAQIERENAAGPEVEAIVEARESVEVADLSWQRPRGFLAPVVEDPSANGEEGAEAVLAPEASLTAAYAEEAVVAADVAPAAETDSEAEPVVSIPRPAESKRQMSLFGGSVDEALLRDAREICESARRASVVLLQRKLRIDYEQALVVLAQLAERGVLELQEDGTQGRVLN